MEMATYGTARAVCEDTKLARNQQMTRNEEDKELAARPRLLWSRSNFRFLQQLQVAEQLQDLTTDDDCCQNRKCQRSST
jgi:hypothetical protein